jgi:flagellar biosynthesis/type III secretory pathway chaperone
MIDPAAVVNDLRAHLALSQELLQLVEHENQSLRASEDASSQGSEGFHLRRTLLPRLDQSLGQLRAHRVAWQRLTPAERQQHPDIAALLRANQDLIMKVLVLDRENEQARLRRGLVPPQHLPPAQRQRPHFVADLYRRHSR